MISGPEPLADHHGLKAFDSGVPALDDWLRRRARYNQVHGGSRTFVAAENGEVVAWYALASGSISVVEAVGRFRRNMPDPVPVMLLARLAVDRRLHGQGWGRALFRDAAQRVSGVAETVGVRGMVVHAISAEAGDFYRALGFEPSPITPRTLMITLADMRKALS